MSIGGGKRENAISKREGVLIMDLSNVRALGKGTMVDRHGHQLSGAAKMTYIVYMFDEKFIDLDPIIVKQGQKYALKALAKIA